MSREKILIIQTAFLGDAILTLPMVQELKKKFNSSEIHIVAIPSTAEIFNSSPYVNKVFVYDKRKSQRSILSLFRFTSELKKEKYTRIYSPHRSLRTSLLVYLCGAEKTFGFDTSAFSFLYKTKIKYEPGIHEVERNLRLIGFQKNNSSWKIKPEIAVDKTIVEKIDSVIQIINGNKIIAIAPGSVWQTKKYPAEYYERIIEHLISKNYFVVLIGGKEDSFLCDNLAKKNNKNAESFAGKLSIIESIELIKRCSLLICNDSAPTHMGMIADVSTLTIYCSTIPGFGFYPYNSKSSFVSFDDLNCKPCGIHGHNKCPINTFDCGFKILPEEIIKKIETMITA